MNQEPCPTSPGERGFSLIEILAVTGIIVVMAAVALPSIGTYVRNYKINGAERSVTSEIAATRTRAITRNTQAGVSFEVVDANTYRFVVEDGAAPTLGDLHDLPNGVIFAIPAPLGAPNATYFRFNRLGAWCNPGSTLACPDPGPAGPPPCPDARCTDLNPTYPPPFMLSDAPGPPGTTVGLLETNTGLVRVIRVNPGGRVQSVPQ